jgi:predicted small integral membrane protein
VPIQHPLPLHDKCATLAPEDTDSLVGLRAEAVFRMGIRICKIFLVTSVAIYCTLVAFNNVTDYGSNFQFVEHVLAMDTTFPGNHGMWRAIATPWVHHAAYLLIIALECGIGGCAWLGATRLWRVRGDPIQFNATKAVANYALALGLALWFVGFIAIGGEWFLMWQSHVWNGVEAAFRIVVYFAIAMTLLNIPDR